jgi:hypothetical protein
MVHSAAHVGALDKVDLAELAGPATIGKPAPTTFSPMHTGKQSWE